MYRVEHIDPSTTALIVVDMQNDFVAPGAPMQSPAGHAMLPHLQRALACCREHGIPVIYTAHVHRAGGCDLGLLAHAPPIGRGEALVDGSPGAAIFPEIAPRDGEIVITKHRFSAFYGTDLEIILRGLGVTTVVITGVTTENCCHATARDAFFRDFQVVFLVGRHGDRRLSRSRLRQLVRRRGPSRHARHPGQGHGRRHHDRDLHRPGHGRIRRRATPGGGGVRIDRFAAKALGQPPSHGCP